MNNFDQIKNALQRIRHFNDLPDEIQQGIAASATHRHFDTGHVIYVEGEPAESIYILESGWIKATRMTREGREQAMMFPASGVRLRSCHIPSADSLALSEDQALQFMIHLGSSTFISVGIAPLLAHQLAMPAKYCLRLEYANEGSQLFSRMLAHIF